MRVKKLQHYNIRTTRFDETVAFYRDVLGMQNAVPPNAPEAISQHVANLYAALQPRSAA